MKPQKKNYSGFVLVGAGLPRTGTTSLRAALAILLDGACHHMQDVVRGDDRVCMFILFSRSTILEVSYRTLIFGTKQWRVG